MITKIALASLAVAICAPLSALAESTIPSVTPACQINPKGCGNFSVDTNEISTLGEMFDKHQREGGHLTLEGFVRVNKLKGVDRNTKTRSSFMARI